LKLLAGWNSLRNMLERGSPTRIFAGRFLSNNTKIIQTARNSQRRRQKVGQRQRVLMARRKRVTVMIAAGFRLLLFGGFLLLLALHIIDYLNSSPRFLVAHIAVKGNTRVPARKIIASSGIVEGKNIFGVSLADSAAAVRRIPWVRDVRIAKKFPDEVLIEITEREPVALVLSRELFYIDEEGKVLEKFVSSEHIDALIVTAANFPSLRPGDFVQMAGAAEALEIIRIINSMNLMQRLRISEINLDDPTNIVLIAEQSGANILMGSGDFRGKLWRLTRVAGAIDQDENLRIANLERMDMRFETIVPARFKNG
jgi:cell division protein FtsQ